MSDLKVKELDFDLLKQQFTDFLKTQTAFKDYNFAGTNMSVMLDVLAYNTYQNGFQDNMVVNEMFIDSAKLESSVASHAKSLNYTPRSRTCAIAYLDVELLPTTNLPFITLPPYTKFTSANSQNGKGLWFYTKEPTIFNRVNGVYRNTIQVYEGRIMEETYYVRTTKPFIELSRDDIDISTIKMTVEDSNGNYSVWSNATSIFDVKPDSKVFYAQTSNLRTYQLYFGENNFGRPPSIGSKVRVSYFYTSGEEGNGVTSFSAPSPSGDISSILIRSVVQSSKYGSDRESIDSIKSNAPLANQVQKRAIVEADYRSLLIERFPQVQAVTAIGGEKLNPPEYGKVAVIVDLIGMDGISQNLADEMTTYLRSRCPVTVQPYVKPAQFAYVAISSKVKFDVKMNFEAVSELQNKVKKSIISYSDEKLEGFNKTFRMSGLQRYIDDSDSSIISNQTIARPVIELFPVVGQRNNARIRFNGRIIAQAEQALRSISAVVAGHPSIPSVKSVRSEQIPGITTSSFKRGNNIVYITDDGFGVLNVVKEVGDTNVVIEKSIGSVDYNSGVVTINSLKIERPEDSQIKVYAHMADNDISAPVGYIIKIREDDVTIELESN